MVDALVSIVLEKLGSIVLDGIEEEERLIVGVKKEIESLNDTFTIIRSVLQDADDKQVKDKAVMFWLEEFKDLSYDAEDILDEWSKRSLIRNVQDPNLNASIIRKVPSHLSSVFSCCKPIVIRHDIGNKIRELNERLVRVVEKRRSYGLREIQSYGQHRTVSSDLVVVEEIYGRDDDKELILTKLLDENAHDESDVRVISIVGQSGFGKTALAKLILEQTKQREEFKFDMHMWVCVSDPFSYEKVMKEVIEQAGNVYEKRFILVLDDVWFHNDSDWRVLKQALDGGAEGSMILITTRDEKVASMIDSSYTHRLGPLPNDACWSLFDSVAFSGREADRDKFKDIGKAISEKCSGNPLGIKVLASLMNLKTAEQQWHDVLASYIWEEDMGGIPPSILLSYYALPSYLKPCVMYFAVFPKDTIFEKKTMIQLWMAQDYLRCNDDRSADLEKKGRDYFDNLSMLSFLQILERDKEGNITSCKMHGLVHDCVRFMSKSSVKVRHLSAQDLNRSSIYTSKKELGTLRSFPTSSNWNRNDKLDLGLFHQLKCLRVLNLQGYQFKELPIEVVQLLQLRYLDLSDNTSLEILPKTICNLHNLQTLKMNRCSSLTRLPEGIGMLSKLRHVEIEGCKFEPYYSQGCEFRTLDSFLWVVVDAQKNKEGCTFEDLKLLNHVEGHLKIIGLGQVTDVSRAAQFMLNMKKKILSLVLDFGWKQETKMEEILEALRPHTNLKKLVIKYYQGIELPSWISSLDNLTVLTLMDLHCLKCFDLSNLPSLEFLHLHGLISVEGLQQITYMHYNEYIEYDPEMSLPLEVIFPKLKKLILSSMPNLDELDFAFRNGNGDSFFPNLEELVLRDFFPKLRKIRIEGLPGLQKLQGLGKLKCLETLELSKIDGLRHSFHEFMGITMTTTSDDTSEGGGGGGGGEFPALTNLCLFGMAEWVEYRNRYSVSSGTIPIMPHLSKLSIYDCPNLVDIPFYLLFSTHALMELTIQNCPRLIGRRRQPWLPRLALKKLKLGEDVGELSRSLWTLGENISYLNYFEISDSSQSSLPKEFNRLKSIRQLVFHNCKDLHFKADDLKHLDKLERLEISNCRCLAKRFNDGDFSSSSYKIIIRPEQRESTEIGESSHSDLEKSYPSDVNVHSGIFCHNCEMYPIDVMRNTPEVLICYNTPSKHPDLANQLHTQGHTFELSNCGDGSGPIHLAEIEEQYKS